MLTELRIRDLGVIADATIELHPGLTVLTGETGAGKTMVVSALDLLTGARADAGLVRTGATRATVEGIIEVEPGHPAAERAAEAGAEPGPDEPLILIRTVTEQGRSRAHVAGRSAPVGVLSELAEHLVAIHGQADQWRLRRPDQHRELLDDYGGAALMAARDEFRAVFAEHSAAVAEITRLQDQQRERRQEIDLLEHGLGRLETLDPQPGEDADLRVESERLAHAGELRGAAAQAVVSLVGDDVGDGTTNAMELIGAARTALVAAGRNDPELAALAERAAELNHLVGDVVSDLHKYAEGIDVDPRRLEIVEQRRAALSELTRTHGPSVDDALAWGAQAAARLAELHGSDDRIEVLAARVLELETALTAVGARLTAAREAAAAALAGAVTAELSHLAMGEAVVSVQVSTRTSPTRDGFDEIEIQLTANPGAAARTVSKAASGGELSRVMLAIEVATAAQTGPAPTFVFDEVDAGVGGKAALDVGARLAALARTAQVVVVTHLAQVAAFADRHLVVHKSSDGVVTASDVSVVEGKEREAEIARMMAGATSAVALRHARELLSQATAVRA